MPKLLKERQITETYDEGGEDAFMDILAEAIAKSIFEERLKSNGKTPNSTDAETHPDN